MTHTGSPPAHPLRLAVLGAGHIARLVHIPTLAGLPGADVVAIADSHAANLAAGLKLAPGARGFPDYREALNVEGLQAAVLTLPSPLHAEAAIAAFAAGLHVYVEKPLAITLDEAERVAAAWRAAGTVGAVGFNFRFNPLFQEARTALGYQQVGVLSGIRTLFTNLRPARGSWRDDPASGNTALLEFGPHHIDMLLHLINSPLAEVTADTENGGDFTTLILRFQNGLLAQSTFAFGAPLQDVFEFMGDKGLLRIARHDLAVQFVPARSRKGKVGRLLNGISGAWTGLTGGLRSRAEPSYSRALEGFVESALSNDIHAHPNIEDGLAVQKVLDAAARSAARQEPIPIAAPQPTEILWESTLVSSPKPGSSPSISMILDKRGPFPRLVPSLRALAGQTIASQIELVIFTNERDRLEDVDHELVGQFERCTAVKHRHSASETLYTAVQAASAPFVCIYEDHVFPASDWAETLVMEFEHGSVGVCTRIFNANPASFLSVVGFVVPYGFFTDPLHYDPADDITFFNGAYRRDALLAFGGRLPQLMKRGGGLNRALVAQGGRFSIAPISGITHVNPSLIRPAITMMLDLGRNFAGLKRKATRMGWVKRLVNVAAGPLIPFQRFFERYPVMFSEGRNSDRKGRTLAALFIGFSLEALGRMAGYLFGEGQAAARLEHIDFNRVEFVHKRDRRLFDSEAEVDAVIRSIPPARPQPPRQPQPEAFQPIPAQVLTRQTPDSTPLLSGIMIKRSPFSVLALSARSLAKQSIASRIELILFTDLEDDLQDIDLGLVSQFERCTIVRHPHPANETFDLAINQASAPLVCQYEDHVFPPPDWAETLVREFEGGCVAACTRIVNGNPASFWSVVSFVVPYGFWIDPQCYDPADDIMFHNGVYRRDALFALGGQLPARLKRGGGLNQALVSAGGRLCITRACKLVHSNPSRPRAAFDLLFSVGRVFADRKRQTTRMGLPKRLLNFAAGPLIPFQRLFERYPIMFGQGRNAPGRLRTILALFVGFAFEALGRMAGYLFGPGSAPQRLERFEVDRTEFLRKADRRFFDLES